MEGAQEQNIIEISGSKDLTNHMERERRALMPYWSKEELNAKIDAITNHKDKMLVVFLWYSGVRITEAINLRKQDIDFKNYTMRLKWLKSRKYKERIAPLHPQLRELLQLYTAPLRADERVFNFTRQRAYQITMRWLKGNPHKIRHSFAVNWLRCGGDLTILHRILGHSKIQTTMEYLKIVPVDQGKELLKINFQ